MHNILLFCDTTQCHCVTFSRRFRSNNLAEHFRNTVSGDVESYLKVMETSHTPLREYTKFHLTRHLKMCNSNLRLKLHRVSTLFHSRSVRKSAV